MEYNQVKDLISTITNTDIKCFELKFENVDIKIDRNTKTIEPIQPIQTTLFTQTTDVAQQVVSNVQQTVETQETIVNEVKGDKVVSPIVGTFYDKSSPDANPFVTVGSKVKKGDVLFIIEAMKVINEITSEYDGEILEILVRDGQMVEFEQPLMIIG